MALIQCPKCNKTVSDLAAACPHCKTLIALPVARRGTPGKRVAKTWESSIRLKFRIYVFLSAYCWWAGVIWFIYNIKKAAWPSVPVIVGLALMLVGAVGYVAAKIRLRRHNKLLRRKRLPKPYG